MTTRVVTVILKAKLKKGRCEEAREVVEKLCHAAVESEPGLITCRVSINNQDRTLIELMEWANIEELAKHYAVYATRAEDLAKFKDCVEMFLESTAYMSENDAQNLPQEVRAMVEMYGTVVVPFNVFAHKI